MGTSAAKLGTFARGRGIGFFYIQVALEPQTESSLEIGFETMTLHLGDSS